MDDHIKQPTDHLPPTSERDADDERTTAGEAYPDVAPTEQGGVSPETAAEPDKPARHGVAKLPPGPH